MSFPHSSVCKESTCNAGDLGQIPRSGKSAGEGIGYPLQYSWASLVVKLVKNPPAMWDTWVRSLGWEDPLEKGKATHFSILAWRIPQAVQFMGVCEKVGFKLNIQKTKIMASSPITSLQIDGETMETVTDFIFWGAKITADGDCSHEIKRCVLPGTKVMTNLESILKSRDITLLTNVNQVKAMIFPVVMYGCESWTIKQLKK